MEPISQKKLKPVILLIIALSTIHLSQAQDIIWQGDRNIAVNGSMGYTNGLVFNLMANVTGIPTSSIKQVVFYCNGTKCLTESVANYWLCGDTNNVTNACPAKYRSGYWIIRADVVPRTSANFSRHFFLNPPINTTQINESNVTNESNITNATNQTNSSTNLSVSYPLIWQEGFTMCTISDIGVGQNARSALKMVNESIRNGECNFLVLNGDFGQAANIEAWYWIDFFHSEVSRAFPVAPIVGNHECQDNGTYNGANCPAWGSYEWWFKERFDVLRTNNVSLNVDSRQRKFSLTIGNLTLVGVDAGIAENDGTYPQFLNASLANSTAFWEIGAWHFNRCEFTTQNDSGCSKVPISIYETARNHGALILNGHKHHYERTKTLSTLSGGGKVHLNYTSPTEVHVGPEFTYISINAVGGMDFYPRSICINSSQDPGCEIWAALNSFEENGVPGVVYYKFNLANNTISAKFTNIRNETIDAWTVYNDKSFLQETNPDIWWESLNQTQKLTIMGKYTNGSCMN